MAVDEYVNEILNSPIYVFDDILGKLIGKNIENAKIELLRHTIDVDNILFEAIKSIIQDLRVDEGVLGRFLYIFFRINLGKSNKRRKQLTLLGQQVAIQHAKVKSERFRIYRQSERMSLSIIDLKQLAESFRKKSIYFQNEKTLKKSKFFIHEIEEKIALLEAYQYSLESKQNSINDVEKIYNSFFKKIPF